MKNRCADLWCVCVLPVQTQWRCPDSCLAVLQQGLGDVFSLLPVFVVGGGNSPVLIFTIRGTNVVPWYTYCTC